PDTGDSDQPAAGGITPMPSHDPGLELFDFTFSARQLNGETGECLKGIGWKTVFTLVQNLEELSEASDALRGDDSKFGEMRAQGVDEHRSLAHQELACLMKHQNSLLIGSLHGDEAHAWPRDGLALQHPQRPFSRALRRA